MEYYIRIFSNSSPVQKIKLEQGETLVGRSRSAGIRVKDQDVSGKQFILRLEGDVLTIENISANGTQLDGQMLFENATVLPGQHIRAGEFLDCIIEDETLSRENDIRLSKGDGKGDTSNVTPQARNSAVIEEAAPKKEQPVVAAVANANIDSPAESHANANVGTSPGTASESPASVNVGTSPGTASESPASVNVGTAAGEEEAVSEKPVTSAGDASGEPEKEQKAGTSPGQTHEEGNPGTNQGASPNTSVDTNTNTSPSSNTGASSNTGTNPDTNTGTGSEAGSNGSSGAVSGTNDTGTGHGRTVANRTRVATPDEIKYIKAQREIRIRRIHAARVALLIVACLMIGALCLLKTETDQVKYEWAKDSDGKWKTDVITFPGMDWQNEGIAVYFPKYDGTKTSAEMDTLVINTFLGNEKLVEMDISLEANKDVRHLNRTLEQDLRAWMMTHGVEGEERWTFETVSQIQFMGADNGLPSVCVPYVRETEKKSRYGLARMFRNGDTAYILQVEVPFEFRLETEHVIDKASFMYVSKKFIQNHWEGGEKPVDFDWSQLRNVRTKIVEASPGRLADLARLLSGILIDATVKKDVKKLDYAMEMLQLLRQSQRFCYNSMKIRYINARIERDRKACDKIRDEGAAMFMVFGDRRYYDIRNNKW